MPSSGQWPVASVYFINEQEWIRRNCQSLLLIEGTMISSRGVNPVLKVIIKITSTFGTKVVKFKTYFSAMSTTRWRTKNAVVCRIKP